MTYILNIFGNIKNFLMASVAILGGLYIAKQKYNAYKAESKLKTIEKEIAVNNVKIAKKKAIQSAKKEKIETDTELKIVKELNKESSKTRKELKEVYKKIEEAKTSEPKKVEKRKRLGKIKISI